MGAVTFDDVQVNFTEEERESLDPSQKNLYKNVMLATFLNLKALGSNWEDHDIEEHFENSRRFKRKIAMEQMRKGRLPMVLRLSVSVYMHSGQHIHTSTQPMTWMWYVCACRCLCVEENMYVGVHVEAREQPQVTQRDCCSPPLNRVP
ncbi:zinc finger protein 878-like [Apodemus sylvaticus]|uniref:zinc finger protein 878-like n=1 Tax=Apodemus sylvaticus TaxID=10129 RepID=UPI00224341E2|nr:zinc finger protein 878-like [Apodemus sylvaticus]XP_052025030.1 zinc finger protein 878-like [Apodemus sylvaticus]XP_052025031.1 zinc finger protein 878-like [Apodemus sylvaticus]XP_052025032.1 zinc finger protein 878-like [Apodemus sylvaticus]